jgi:hypothetical protein
MPWTLEGNVKKTIGLTVLALAILAAPALCQEHKVNWQESLAAALKKAAEENKAVFADFTGRKN